MRTMSGGPCSHYDCTNRTSFGYCKTTACINPKYSNIGTAQYGQGVQKRIVTNADLIRAMTDEELAELLEMIPHLGNPPTYTIDGFCIDDGLRTKRQWLDWLRKEAKDEEIQP